MNINQNNLYNYSVNLNLVNSIKEERNENNILQVSSEPPKKNEFLLELVNILESKLKTNIRLHQKGFEIYKEKLLSEKSLILNSLSKDIKNLTINQLIDVLISMKEEQKNEKEYFNIGQNCNSNKTNIGQNAIKKINELFSDYSTNNNMIQFHLNNNDQPTNNMNIKQNKINDKFKFDPKNVYHSPSPLFLKKQESKIIQENKNVNKHINFYEEQKIKDN